MDILCNTSRWLENIFQEGTMKRIVLFSFLILVIGGSMVFAQTATPTATVNGTLGLKDGRVVLKSGTTTYYTRGIERYIGFIDGLRDGVQATIEGYVSAPSLEGETERLLFPVKLTLNGKVYEVGPSSIAYPGWHPPSGHSRMGRGGSHGRW
jgi:hypothetical protein